MTRQAFWVARMCIVLDYAFLKGLHIMLGLILLPQRESEEIVRSDKLFEHCAKIDEAARNRMELIVRSLAEQNGVTEQLKAENQMEWVRQMNACKAQAEEVVKFELIYD